MAHSVVIYALMVSWYPRRRFGNPIGDVMMDLDPWRFPCMVKVFEEAFALEEISTQNGPFNFYSNSMSPCVSQ